jgi:DNA-binding NarL/FixJ family response regulator
MRKKIKVMCVDDHAFLAEGLRTRFSMESDLEFVAWLPQADRLVEEARAKQPDVVLLDIEMPGADPFETVEALHRLAPDARVIMFSAYIRDHYIDAAVSRGAWGYLSKSDPPEVVIDAIRKVERGEFAFGPKVLERFQSDRLGRRDAGEERKTKLDLLTPREKQVLRLIGQGLSRTEIAKSLHRSAKTIDNYRASIMEKLEIRDRVELARYAIREGLSEP